ncbi:MAG: hypothetical protein IKQ87_00760 [Clostridia bacterium]|nr:hypothetical protein [Clostridia bacterium]
MRQKIRRILAFVIAAVLIQGLALLFFTPAGIERLLFLPLRLHAEKFKPDNNAYAVYYDTRTDVAAADLIVVGIDTHVAESYDALGHFSRYVKQYNDFSAVLMPFTRAQITITGSLMKQTDEEKFRKRIQSLNESYGLSADCCDYLSELFYVNTTMSAAKKFNVVSFSDDAEGSDTSRPAQIAEAYRETERSALCVVDTAFLKEEADELARLLPDATILTIGMYYDRDTVSPWTHEAVTFPDFSAGPACFFVKNSTLGRYYRYYHFVTDLFDAEREDPVDARFTDYFFVIANGTPATPGGELETP